jgi:O-antigen/teichoic acid export membrane protein
LQKYALILAAPFFAASVVLFLGASPIIKLVYGHKYIPVIPLLRIWAFDPFLLALQHVFSTFYMLAFGYEKEWSRVILQSTVLNFIILIPLIYSIWPPAATSITGVSLDVFVVAVTYLFYRKSTSPIRHAVAA